MLKDINTVDLKLLSVFIPDYANHFSIREMVRKLNINYSHAFKRVKILVKKKIILEKKGRHSSEISFNLNNLSSIKLLCFVEEQMTGELEFVKLNQVIKEISLIDSFACIGLFGSRVSGKARTDSDWDIFIITSQKKEIAKWCKANVSLYRDVQFQIFSLEEFRDSLKSIEETVVRHIVRNKKVLYNPHPFYNLIRDWERLKYAPSQTN